ncbi:MAG: hypothetical protein RLZ98_214 [Pseudomonadota bacterium]|jgi:pyruvate dehydrogenase E1 component alpha subunit
MVPGTHFANALGEFIDPGSFTAAIDATDVDGERGRRLLRDLLLIRFGEECIADLVVNREAKCPCHLGIGQEAIAVGISEHLRASDRVFSGHRSHAHFLALGGSLDGLIAEILGRAVGVSGGMGGSMHLYAPEVGFHGSVPIVAGTIPIALGAALAAKLDGSDVIAVSYFGDGASEEGVLHETMNLASTMQLPVLFVCENNLFSSHLDIHLRQPSNRVARFAEVHDIEAVTIDGNDVLAVSEVAKQLIERMRATRSPAFIEAITYRHRGHVGPNEDVDVGVLRRLDVLDAWKQRDPIERFKKGLFTAGVLKQKDVNELENEIRQACNLAVEKAREAPYPPQSDLFKFVYGGNDR